MSRTGVWISIISWAVLAVMTAWASVRVVNIAYPDLHPGLLAMTGFFAVQAVYGLRSFARRRGWAMASYAPVKD